MAEEKTVSNSEHSAELLLAEHSRISILYEANAENGDKYVTTYLTTLSLTIALLVGISKIGPPSRENLYLDLALTMVLVLIGLTIFRRLIDRRIDMIEYLRAINRINHYFAAKDKEVKNHLYWEANDDEPPMYTKGTFLGGLRNIVMQLNSLSIGILIYFAVQLIAPSVDLLISVLISIVGVVITFCALSWYGRILEGNAGKRIDRNIKYPRSVLPETNGKGKKK